MAVLLHELVTVEVLARGFAAAHEEEVVACKGEWISRGEEGVDDHGEGDAPGVDGGAEGRVVAVHPEEDVRQARAKEVETEQRATEHKGEEVSIVAASDAVVQPHAVMILGLDTIVADAAVVCARRAPDVTRLAVLGWDLHCGRGRGGGDDHCPFGRRGPEGQGVFVGWRGREGV